MKYLLDTCAFLWLAEGNAQLTERAWQIIDDPDNEGAVSVVSLWELSMKAVVGKLSLTATPVALGRRAADDGLSVIPLLVSHVERFHHLHADHRDAFDRLLAAVAEDGSYTIISPDPCFDAFNVSRIW